MSNEDRAERARSGRGSLAYLAKGQPSVVDELLAERRAEAGRNEDAGRRASRPAPR